MSITCPKCGVTSHNKGDELHRFCIKCGFYDDIKREALVFTNPLPVVCNLCSLLVGWTDKVARLDSPEHKFVCIPCFDQVIIVRD